MTDILTRNRSFVIAEAGTCHADPDPRKRLDKALRYVQVAADAGASAVKFQVFNSPVMADFFCYIQGDEERSIRWEESTMKLSDWSLVKETAEHLGIKFLASVFQHSTIAWMDELKVDAIKVASRAAKDFPYKDGMEYLVSDGMYDPPERDDITLMQCEAVYPSSEWWCGILPGFSDHSGTPSRALHAIRQGCKLVEVHFYDEPEDAGPDLIASLDAGQLKMVCMGA